MGAVQAEAAEAETEALGQQVDKFNQLGVEDMQRKIAVLTEQLKAEQDSVARVSSACVLL